MMDNFFYISKHNKSLGSDCKCVHLSAQQSEEEKAVAAITIRTMVMMIVMIKIVIASVPKCAHPSAQQSEKPEAINPTSGTTLPKCCPPSTYYTYVTCFVYNIHHIIQSEPSARQEHSCSPLALPRYRSTYHFTTFMCLCTVVLSSVSTVIPTMVQRLFST